MFSILCLQSRIFFYVHLPILTVPHVLTCCFTVEKTSFHEKHVSVLGNSKYKAFSPFTLVLEVFTQKDHVTSFAVSAVNRENVCEELKWPVGSASC